MMAGSGLTNVERVCGTWIDPPQWLMILARECDRSSQKKAGAKIGRSGGWISRLFSNDPKISMAEAERLVSATLCADRVNCPIFGDMALARCITVRRKTGPLTTLMERQFAETCPKCPNNSDKGAQK